MKILHTADWHLGKYLHKVDLLPEMLLFLDWLHTFISDEGVKVLLVSGDIFDTANPSHEAKTAYFGFLAKMIPLGVKVIIIGGNHDSVSLLEGPSEVLENLDIHIIGGGTLAKTKGIIPILDSERNVNAVVLAVPFLRDGDVMADLNATLTKDAQIKEGITRYYQDMFDLAKAEYPGELPLIAMGHLLVVGSEMSDSERDIHIGNLGALSPRFFGERFDYVALGHIHKPQVFFDGKVRYAGSPICLSFSEKNYSKQVVLLELSGGIIQGIEPIPVPKYRTLVQLRGTLEEVRTALREIDRPYMLPNLVEIHIEEQHYSAEAMLEFQSLSQTSEQSDYQIAFSKITFKETPFEEGMPQAFQTIEEVDPRQMLLLKLDNSTMEEEEKSDILEAYEQILQEILDEN